MWMWASLSCTLGIIATGLGSHMKYWAGLNGNLGQSCHPRLLLWATRRTFAWILSKPCPRKHWQYYTLNCKIYGFQNVLDDWKNGSGNTGQGVRNVWLVILKMLQLFKILQLIWQLVLFKMIQLQGANPMTPIEVKSQQLMIFKNASASGGKPPNPLCGKIPHF